MKKTLKNNKGFTLVELLAVIVILAVVMLIGITAVGPMMNKAKKRAFLTEATSFETAAKNALQSEKFDTMTLNTNYYVDYKYLQQYGYIDKDDDTYSGCVMLNYSSDGELTVTQYSLKNATYSITKKNTTTYSDTGLFDDTYATTDISCTNLYDTSITTSNALYVSDGSGSTTSDDAGSTTSDDAGSTTSDDGE